MKRRETPRPLRAARLVVALLLLFQLGLQIHLSRADSQTTDEGVHLSAGYSYWEWGDFTLNPEHPPLVKLLAGAAAHGVHPVFPAVQHRERLSDFFYDSWRENRALGEAFLYEAGNDADRLLFVARLPAIALTLLLGAAIFSVAASFFGPLGGVLATALYVFDPTVAAHGHLITTDIAVALGGVAVFAVAWRFAHQPDATSTILLGVALGVASLAKFTSVIFFPSLAVVLLLICGGRVLIRLIPRLIAAVLVAWLVILAGYGFSILPPPPVSSLLATVSPDSGPPPVVVEETLNRAYGVMRHLGRPREYFKGLALVLGHVAGGHVSFLLGELSPRGWWYYFPVVFATKTPVAVLLLLIVAVSVAARKIREPAQWYWLVAGGSYFLCAMTSHSDLGFRHLLPAMVFLYIWMGSLAQDLRTRRWLTLVTTALVLWLAVDFGRSSDRYFGYFNELVGDRGYLVANDSNLDWGQDLKRIRAYLDRHAEIEAPYVEYPADGPSSLDYYGIRHRPAAVTPADSGVLIIGVTRLSDPSFAFLRALPIADRITPGVFVYRLPGTS